MNRPDISIAQNVDGSVNISVSLDPDATEVRYFIALKSAMEGYGKEWPTPVAGQNSYDVTLAPGDYWIKARFANDTEESLDSEVLEVSIINLSLQILATVVTNIDSAVQFLTGTLVNIDNTPIVGAKIEAFATKSPLKVGPVMVSPFKITARTDSTGFWQLRLLKGASVTIVFPGHVVQEIVVTQDDTRDISQY